MKRIVLFLFIVLAGTTALHAQTRTVTPPPFNSSRSVQSPPTNLIGTGVNNHQFQWNTQGTVSAGACALQGGNDGTTFGTTIIAAQTVTSSGGPTALTAGVYNYVRLNCTTPLMGSGNVTITYFGYTGGGTVVSGSVSITGTVNVDPTANTIGLATGAKQDTGNTSLAAIDADLGATTSVGCITYDATVCTLIGAVKGTNQLLQTPTGQQTMANSNSVTLASNQTAFTVNPASATVPASTMNSASANSGVNSAMAAVFDDAAPTSITENSFGFVRMSANRNAYNIIRDAAGNERGANVNSANQIGVIGPPQATTAGGATPGSWLSNNSDTEIIIKASPGQVYKLDITNVLAAPMYVRAYDLTNPDCTSATGIVQRWIIPANTTGAGGSFSSPVGKVFSTGISLCVTTTISDTNNTAIATGSAAVSYEFN